MKNKKTKKQVAQEIISTQEFSPVKDVREGIIITKDGRFIKLLEFSPINFMLRSQEEQGGIISNFAGALKAMPVRVQFKCISRKADVTKHIKDIQDCKVVEENKNCRVLQQDQMKLIKTIGGQQGVSRRFFLIFEYENPPTQKTTPTFDEVAYQLYTVGRRISQMLSVCGNEVLSSDADDEYTLSVLYSILCRSESTDKKFDERITEVFSRYMADENFDSSQDIFVPANDLICPQQINTKASAHYMVVDDMFYAFYYVPSDSYPTQAVGGWLSILINIGLGVDVDFFIEKQPVASIQTKLQYRLRFNKVKARSTDDSSGDYEDLMNAISAGYYLKQGVSNNEDFCYMATLITITASSLEELELKCNEIKTIMISQNLRIKPCSYQQEEAFKMTLPICYINKGLFRKCRRNILTSSLASAYPFVSFEISDDHGVMLGTNESNNSLVFLDNFDSSKYKNANMAILGTSGAGKTYTLQSLALRMRQKGTQVFIIAPEKGHEFRRACTAIGGQFISIAPGSEHNINIMEVRKTDHSTANILDGGQGKSSILAAKMQQLLVFFTLLIPDISNEEKQLLDEAIVNTYAKFGITNDNASLFDPSRPEHYRKMPTLGDLHKQLEQSGDYTKRLYNILTRYVKGSASSFNQPTNVNLDNKYIVVDVSNLSQEMLPVGMFIVLDFIWDKIREDRTVSKAVFLDELWALIGTNSSPEAAKFVLRIFKVIRGYAGAAIAATQDLNDFFALEDGKYGKGIINNSKIKIVMNLEQEEADRVKDTLSLSQREIQQISRFQRGSGLLCANTNHVLVKFMASQSENDLITTDPKQLKALKMKYAKEQEI